MAQPGGRTGPFARVLGRLRFGRSESDAAGWAPMQAVSFGAQDRNVVREVEQIARAVADVGAISARGLAHVVGARYWGPGRFRRALRAARQQGRVRRVGRGTLGDRIYGPPS